MEQAKKMPSEKEVIDFLEENGIQVQFRPVAIIKSDLFAEEPMDIYQAYEKMNRARFISAQLNKDPFQN